MIFRRESEQITNPGGLWDEANEIYPHFGGVPNHNDKLFKFPNFGNYKIKFAGLQREKDVTKWQGSQVAYLGYDELTHFTQYQFLYLLSRNRSVSGVRPYVRATCNPDADSWLASFLSFWINQETGFPIPSRAGKIRYFIYDNNAFHWSGSKQILAEKFPHLVEKFGEQIFKSVAFFPADVFDNQILLANDPLYLANLLSLPLVERERLLGGNWKIRVEAGKFINRGWFKIVPGVSFAAKDQIDVRFWDFAATAKEIGKAEPDFTATAKFRYDPAKNKWTITDAFQFQENPATVEQLFFQTAELDRIESKRTKTKYRLRWETEPGSAAKRETDRLIRELGKKGIRDAAGVLSRDDKYVRGRDFAVNAEHGNISIVEADWNEMLLKHLHQQPHKINDLYDACTGCFNASNDLFDMAGGQ